jgi:hypothetical protein
MIYQLTTPGLIEALWIVTTKRDITGVLYFINMYIMYHM